MNSTFRVVAVALLTAAFAVPASAQPKDKPLPEPLPMGIAYYYQPGNPYWYAPVTPSYPPGKVIWHASTGTYTTVYPATRPVVYLTPAGPVLTTKPTAPVVVGPTWALTPIKIVQPFGASGPGHGW